MDSMFRIPRQEKTPGAQNAHSQRKATYLSRLKTTMRYIYIALCGWMLAGWIGVDSCRAEKIQRYKTQGEFRHLEIQFGTGSTSRTMSGIIDTSKDSKAKYDLYVLDTNFTGKLDDRDPLKADIEEFRYTMSPVKPGGPPQLGTGTMARCNMTFKAPWNTATEALYTLNFLRYDTNPMMLSTTVAVPDGDRTWTYSFIFTDTTNPVWKAQLPPVLSMRERGLWMDRSGSNLMITAVVEDKQTSCTLSRISAGDGAGKARSLAPHFQVFDPDGVMIAEKDMEYG